MGFDCYLREQTGVRYLDHFHLNVSDMSRARRLMLRYGMGVNCPEVIDYPRAEYDAARAVSASPAFVDRTTPEWDAYVAAHQRWLEQGVEAPGIPIFKLGSPDGWHVTVDECESAIKQYEQAGSPVPSEARDYWGQWIGFLLRATMFDGFEVW